MHSPRLPRLVVSALTEDDYMRTGAWPGQTVPTAKYPGDPGTYYANDDCAGFYADEGYTNLVLELCSGETGQGLADQSISSVMLGRDVHVNLYTDTEFGAGSSRAEPRPTGGAHPIRPT